MILLQTLTLLTPFLLSSITASSTHSSCKLHFTDDNPSPFSSTPTPLQAVLLLPYNTTYLASCQKVAPAIQATLNKIYRLGILPTTIRINVTTFDTECDPTLGTWAALKGAPEPTHLFLGPHCDYVMAPVARSLKFIGTPAVATGAMAYDFGRTNRSEPDSEYYMLVRTGWTFLGMARAVESVFKKYGWGRYVALFEEHGRCEVNKEQYCYLAMQAMYEVLVLKGLLCEIEQHRILKDSSHGRGMEEMLRSKLMGKEQKKRTYWCWWVTSGYLQQIPKTCFRVREDLGDGGLIDDK